MRKTRSTTITEYQPQVRNVEIFHARGLGTGGTEAAKKKKKAKKLKTEAIYIGIAIYPKNKHGGKDL